jgi:hypothetical protein
VGAAFHIIGIRGSSPAESRKCGVAGEVEVRLKPWRSFESRSFPMRGLLVFSPVQQV